MVDSFSLTGVLNILVPKPIQFGAHTLVLSLACLLRNLTGSSVWHGDWSLCYICALSSVLYVVKKSHRLNTKKSQIRMSDPVRCGESQAKSSVFARLCSYSFEGNNRVVLTPRYACRALIRSANPVNIAPDKSFQ